MVELKLSLILFTLWYLSLGLFSQKKVKSFEYPDRRVKITILYFKCIDTHDDGVADNDEDRLYFRIIQPEYETYPKNTNTVFRFEPGEEFNAGTWIDRIRYDGVIWEGIIKDKEFFDIDLLLINSFDGSKNEKKNISMGYIPLTLQNNFGYVVVDWSEYTSENKKIFTDSNPEARKVFGTSVIIDKPVEYPGKEVIVEYKLKYEYWSVVDDDDNRVDWIKSEEQNDSEYIIKVKIEID